MDVEVSMTTMYCSLKEAYRVPDFDSNGRKKKSCDAQGQLPSDSNDAYFPESGKGEFARYNSSYVERFENPAKLPESRDKIAYSAQAPDYDYYCKSYNICPSTKVEGFQNSTATQQCSSPAPQRYELPVSQQAQLANSAALKASLDSGQKPTMSAPYVVPRREVDMSKVAGYYDEDLEQYLQTSIMKSTPAQTPLANPRPHPEWLAQPNDYTDTPLSRAHQYFEKVPATVHTERVNQKQEPLKQAFVEAPIKYKSSSSTTLNSWQNFWDMGIFIIAGLLIIVLCEQLFKVATMVGMRKTFEMLEPYLQLAK